MTKKLEKVLKDANKKLEKEKIFINHKIAIDGDFKSEYNFIELAGKHHHFPIATAATEAEAIAAINGYMVGLSHGENKSYPKFCDKE